MADVLISYPRKDQWIMRTLRAEIEKAGFSVWVDEKLEPGKLTWQQAIAREVEVSRCVVVIITANTKPSEWMEREVQYARNNGKVVIPVLVTGNAADVPFYMVTDQAVDLHTDFDAGVKRLLTFIRRFVPQRSPLRLDRVGSIFDLNPPLWRILDDIGMQVEPNPADIERAIRGTYHHAQRLEAPESILERLRRMLKDEYDESDVFNTFPDLEKVIAELGKLITAADPDWQPFDPDSTP